VGDYKDPKQEALTFLQKLKRVRESKSNAGKWWSRSFGRKTKQTSRIMADGSKYIRPYLGFPRSRLPKPRKGFCDMRRLVRLRMARKYGRSLK